MNQKRILIVILISLLNGCSSMSGNVVPQQGPTMEQVYDSVVDTKPIEKIYIFEINHEKNKS